LGTLVDFVSKDIVLAALGTLRSFAAGDEAWSLSRQARAQTRQWYCR